MPKWEPKHPCSSTPMASGRKSIISHADIPSSPLASLARSPASPCTNTPHLAASSDERPCPQKEAMIPVSTSPLPPVAIPAFPVGFMYTSPEGEAITYLDFYLDGNDRLCLKREGAEPEALTSENIKINNLVFNYLVASSTESVQIQISTSYSQPVGKIGYQATTTLTATASLRND